MRSTSTGFLGAILIVSCIWVWVRRDALAHRRRLVTATTVFAAIALVLALGRYGGLDGVIAHLPVLRSIRAPDDDIVLVQFALAVLAAITMDDLLAIAHGAAGELRRFASVLWIPAALGLLTTLLLNTGVLPYGRHTFARLTTASAGVAIVAIATLLTTLAGRRAAWALPALIVVTALDLGAWGIRFVYPVPARTIESLTEQVPAAPQALPTLTPSCNATARTVPICWCCADIDSRRVRRDCFPRRHIPLKAKQRSGCPGHAGYSRRTAAASRSRPRLQEFACSTGRAATRAEAPGSSSIGRAGSWPTSTCRDHALLRSRSAITTAGRQPPTAHLCQPSAWRTIFSDASCRRALMK